MFHMLSQPYFQDLIIQLGSKLALQRLDLLLGLQLWGACGGTTRGYSVSQEKVSQHQVWPKRLLRVQLACSFPLYSGS